MQHENPYADIIIRKAERTKTGYKLIYDYNRSRFSVNVARAPHKELIQALDNLHQAAADLGQRAKHPTRPVFCQGIDVKSQKKHVGYVLIGIQSYNGVDFSEKFTTARYWSDGKINVLPVGIRQAMEEYVRELQVYAAEGQPGYTNQQDMFDAVDSSTNGTDPTQNRPAESSATIHKMPAPNGKKPKTKQAKKKTADTPAFEVTKGATTAAQKMAEQLSGEIVPVEDLAIEWHGVTNWYTVKFRNELMGYIKKEGKKTVFSPTNKATESTIPQRFLTGKAATAQSQTDGVKVPDKLIARIEPGFIAEHEGVKIAMAHASYDAAGKAWYIQGYSNGKDTHILLDTNTVFHGPKVQEPNKAEIPAEEQIRERIQLFRSQQETLANLHAKATNQHDLDTLEDLSRQVLLVVRNYNVNVILHMKDAQHLSAKVVNELTEMFTEQLKLIENINAEAFEGNYPQQSSGSELVLAAAAAN